PRAVALVPLAGGPSARDAAELSPRYRHNDRLSADPSRSLAARDARATAGVARRPDADRRGRSGRPGVARAGRGGGSGRGETGGGPGGGGRRSSRAARGPGGASRAGRTARPVRGGGPLVRAGSPWAGDQARPVLSDCPDARPAPRLGPGGQVSQPADPTAYT